MKKVILILLVVCVKFYAQEKSSLYVNGGIGLGNYLSGDIGVTYVYKKNISLYLGYLGGGVQLKNYRKIMKEGF